MPRLGAMLGVHFAITPEQENALLAADGDLAEVGSIVSEIEESWGDDRLKVDTDKAWDAIHRSLTDGTLDPDGGEFPLSHAVTGGRHLHDEYHVVLITASEVPEVAKALQEVDRRWLRQRFDLIDDPDYSGAGDDDDFDYTWTNFADLQRFFQRAAAAHRAVLFTAM
ncbi:YfbM family protein [Actinoplanes sp. G11-F43]|uniref:YfbM family protein n=1 Tax=Actinoplanes sp. G11-F43 TaxID=3424130 RepID=UPI003D34B69D